MAGCARAAKSGSGPRRRPSLRRLVVVMASRLRIFSRSSRLPPGLRVRLRGALRGRRSCKPERDAMAKPTKTVSRRSVTSAKAGRSAAKTETKAKPKTSLKIASAKPKRAEKPAPAKRMKAVPAPKRVAAPSAKASTKRRPRSPRRRAPRLARSRGNGSTPSAVARPKALLR